MKKPILLLHVLIICIFVCISSYAQSNSKVRHTQIVLETPDNTTSATLLDITLLDLENIHSILIQYGVDSDIDQFYNQLYTLNSTTNVSYNIITDEGNHAVIDIGNFPVSNTHILTISFLDASGVVIESKQIK